MNFCLPKMLPGENLTSFLSAIITKRILVLLPMVAIALPSLAHVERTHFLKGKVGGREIGVKMLCYDELPTRLLYYFFQDEKRDKQLVGTLKDKVWNFTPEERSPKPAFGPEGLISISESGEGRWTGKWVDSSGKAFNLVLEPILPDFINSAFSGLPIMTELDPYERYKLSNINLAKTKTEKLTGNLFIDWYSEKESHVRFFRLRAGSRLKTDSINWALQALHLSLIRNYFKMTPPKADTRTETVIQYLTDELVSFNVAMKNPPGAGHAVNDQQVFTFDLRSGQQVELENLIWFDPTKEKPPLDDLYKVFKYRKNVFAPKLFGLLKQLYPDNIKSSDCGINKVESWILPVWNLTAKGLAFGFSKSDCDVRRWAIVPYETLAPYLQTKYHFER